MEENPLIEEDWNGSLVLILQTSPHTQSLAITASTVRTVPEFFQRGTKSQQDPHRFCGSHIQEQDMTVYSTPSAWASLARLHDARGPI